MISKTIRRGDILWAVLAVLFAGLFTLIIWILTPALAAVEAGFLPDQGPAWYFWKLPNPTTATHLSAWLGYGLHQIATWACIVWAVKWKKKEAAASGGAIAPRFGNRLILPGAVFMGINAFFFFVHLGQTHVFYDGLAQDVSVFSSQASVVVMLILILILMNDRRGLFFGKKIPMPQAAVAFIKKYHGYYIAWALVYSFWFHPMTGAPGQLMGFFYMFVLLAQGGLMYTKTHTSPRWAFVLESMVLVHGTVVALMQGTALWTMFACGFGFLFIVTQMYGFKFPRWLNIVFTAAFVVIVVLIYSGILVQGKSFKDIHQVLWIPAIEYALIPAFLLIGALGSWLRGRIVRRQE